MMPRMDKLSNYKTTVAQICGMMRVVYHNTAIVSWDDKEIVLTTGGWRTVTTKRKMNQAATQFGLGFRVFQHDGDWFVRKPDGGDLPFDGNSVTLTR